ncbi:MAG: bifunctional DNA-formamidopyrimidine glycosylase/DNA-(apurinic or apyrimidinic site) lyase [Gammaproteobacteria bacterium]|nr:bifunctional DNA-formamidopyrimidine glycosylase/DNA-(apurinic or apyrimidinic site) lyase [Gammaproteobacteria bacterium]
MPELPEVETTRRGISPHVKGQTVRDVIVRHQQLRWPVPRGLKKTLQGQRINSVSRRAKYLLLGFDHGTLILHLGMSGSLRIIEEGLVAGKHDHLDILLESGKALRLTDPRRFGAVLWTQDDPNEHALLAHLGPEPLSDAFTHDTLFPRSRGRKGPIKPFIMEGRVVVGVGNIYASEALFLAGINPKTVAGKVSRARYDKLAAAIKQVLAAAIAQGGTTLRDFVGGDGKPGYFAQQLNVYGREGEACHTCGTPIKQITQGQRSSYYCPRCQH